MGMWGILLSQLEVANRLPELGATEWETQALLELIEEYADFEYNFPNMFL